MAHTKSAEKRMRQDEKRRLRNRQTKKAIKVQTKKVLALVKSGSADDLRQEVVLAIKKLDKAAARRILHPNTAARKKSQLARLLHKKAGGTPAAAGS